MARASYYFVSSRDDLNHGPHFTREIDSPSNERWNDLLIEALCMNVACGYCGVPIGVTCLGGTKSHNYRRFLTVGGVNVSPEASPAELEKLKKEAVRQRAMLIEFCTRFGSIFEQG